MVPGSYEAPIHLHAGVTPSLFHVDLGSDSQNSVKNTHYKCTSAKTLNLLRPKTTQVYKSTHTHTHILTQRCLHKSWSTWNCALIDQTHPSPF